MSKATEIIRACCSLLLMKNEVRGQPALHLKFRLQEYVDSFMPVDWIVWLLHAPSDIQYIPAVGGEPQIRVRGNPQLFSPFTVLMLAKQFSVSGFAHDLKGRCQGFRSPPKRRIQMKLLHSWASSEIARELSYIFLGISFHEQGLMQSSIRLLTCVC